jgi:hypothetical protein
MTQNTTGLLAFAALFTLTGCPNMTGAHKGVAEDEAKEWAAELKLDVEAITCREKDTDGDGYVSCTIKTTDGQLLEKECAGARSTGNMIRNSGCREPKLNLGGKTE